MLSGLSHITLSVKDLSRSFHFYTGLLGLKPVAKWPKGAYLTAGDLWLALHVDERTRAGPLPEYTHIAFRVDQIHFADLCARLQLHGVARFQDNRTEGDSFYFLDPDGHKLEIHVGDLASRLRSMRAAPWEGLVVL